MSILYSNSIPFFMALPHLPMGTLFGFTVILALLCAAAAHLLVDLLFKRRDEYSPPISTLARLVGDLASSVKRFILFSAPAAIAMMAMWCVFLTAPGTAHADEEQPTKRAVHHRRTPPQPDEANKKFEAYNRSHSKPPKPGPKAKKGSK